MGFGAAGGRHRVLGDGDPGPGSRQREVQRHVEADAASRIDLRRVPCAAGGAEAVGEWNSEEITARGPKITVVLNGKTLVDADISTVKDPEVLKKHPGLLRKSGRIGFLGHNSRVEFRNIAIKRL